MRILFLDYLSYSGHKNFNKIHIESLLQLGNSIHLVGRVGQFDNIEKSDKIQVSVMLEFFFSKSISPLFYRIKYILGLLWARWKLHMRDYDMVIIPTYDPLSVFAFRTKKPTVTITHDAHYLDNRIKMFFYNLTPRHYIQVGLNESMAEHLKQLLPRRRVFYIPHGLVKVSTKLSKPIFIDDTDTYLFCPVNRWFDADLVKQTFENNTFCTFLSQNQIKLIVKEQLIGADFNNPRVIRVKNMLEKAEYDYLLQNALAVILPYDSVYMYRCSGIMFECVARDTPVIASNIKSMSIFKNTANMALFSTAKELIDGVERFRKKDVIQVDKSIFTPLNYWKKVLNYLFPTI